MFCLVTIAGWIWFLMAKFSVGRPKASQPMGNKTLYPSNRFFRPMMSMAVLDLGWPTCSPAPEG